MKNLVVRILLISDFHFMAIPVGFQKGQIIKGISRLVEGVISIWKRWNNWNFYRSVEELSYLGNFKLVVVLGDMFEADYNERGFLGYFERSALEKIKEALACLRIKSMAFQFIPGDHELGYKLPLSVDPGGGVSLTSVENYTSFVGPLYSQMNFGNFRLIFLSSSLFIQSWDERNEFERSLLDYFKAKQETFLLETLSGMAEDKKVIVFVHDPDSVEAIHCLLPSRLRSKIFKIFCGHMHAESSIKKYRNLGRVANSWKARFISLHPKGKKVMEWARGNLLRYKLFKMYNLTVVPAFGGMMGKGGGFLVLNLFEDGTIEIEKH